MQHQNPNSPLDPAVLRSVCNVASDGINIIDRNGRIIVWNQKMAEITGVAAAEAEGRPHRASGELARRGGGLLHWWVTAPTAEHEQAAEATGFDPYRRLHRMERPLLSCRILVPHSSG